MPEEDATRDGQATADDGERDFAIIVGVTRYPELSRDGGSADLQGSGRDALKVRDWLVNDEGGGVPRGNVWCITRAEATAHETADPTRDAIVKAFTEVYKRCWPNGPAGAPQVPTGRRLYVYVSGHGLSSDLDHGALLCSNSSDNLYSTLAPYASLRAFRQAGFFEQFVIWFDGCMDWAGIDPEGINYNPRPGQSFRPPGPVFTAYAAHPRLKTVECPDDAGLVRGVFTRTLLKGLEGEAADPETGLIDGFSLQKYLWNTMPKYLPDSAKENVLVDKQPFIRTDPGIVFGRAKQISMATVVLRFAPQQNGAEAQVWGRKPDGLSFSLLAKQEIVNGQAKFTLPNGIFAVNVPEHGLRTGFEVTGAAVTKLVSA
jgi:hypothetical protein